MAAAKNTSVYESVTHAIRVSVAPAYLGHSMPTFPGQYLFNYNITITNESLQPVRLMRRHWIITDGHGQVQEVKGAGVVGKQPTILPGGSHSYSSFCPIPTEIGRMEGSYQMESTEGIIFDVTIPTFPLLVPGIKN